MTDVPIAREKLRKSPQFCRDLPAGEATHERSERNQERACCREFSKIGHPVLHVCLVKDGQQNDWGGYHNVHIDPHQIAKEKTKRCSCWYAGIQNHFKDVGDYIIRSFVVKKVLRGVTARMPKELEQIIEDSLTKALHSLVECERRFRQVGGQVLGPQCRLARLCGPCARLTESSRG